MIQFIFIFEGLGNGQEKFHARYQQKQHCAHKNKTLCCRYDMTVISGCAFLIPSNLQLLLSLKHVDIHTYMNTFDAVHHGCSVLNKCILTAFIS